MNPVKKTRSFVAIDLPQNIRTEIRKIQEKLPKFKGKITEFENLHLTLKFLGHIPEETLEEVKKKLGLVKFRKFETEIDKIGVFAPRIVWLHMTNCLELQKEIDEKLSDLFEKERRLMGHITIARVKDAEDRNAFLEKLKKIKIPPMLKFVVKNFKLKKAVLTRKGPAYEDLEEYSLE